MTHFSRLCVEYIFEKIKRFIGNQNIIANIYRIQANDSVTFGYFCIGFIDSMLDNISLTVFTSPLSLYYSKEHDKKYLNIYKNRNCV